MSHGGYGILYIILHWLDRIHTGVQIVFFFFVLSKLCLSDFLVISCMYCLALIIPMLFGLYAVW